MAKKITLPDGAELTEFTPIAYFDKHMDCIRVITHDRSVTEHRLNESFTLYECNHRGEFDPVYIGFSIKGIRHLFDEIGLDLDGAYTVAEIITEIVRHKPGSNLAVMLNLIFQSHVTAGDIRVDMSETQSSKAA